MTNKDYAEAMKYIQKRADVGDDALRRAATIPVSVSGKLPEEQLFLRGMDNLPRLSPALLGAVGVLTGAGAGAVIAGKGKRMKGAGIGAAIGGTLGAGVGYPVGVVGRQFYNDKLESDYHYYINNLDSEKKSR